MRLEWGATREELKYDYGLTDEELDVAEAFSTWKHVEREELFFRAVDQNPEVQNGDLVFRGTRVPVETLMDILRHGGTVGEF